MAKCKAVTGSAVKGLVNKIMQVGTVAFNPQTAGLFPTNIKLCLAWESSHFKF